MQRSQTETIGLVLNGEALVVRFFPNSAASPFSADLGLGAMEQTPFSGSG